MDHTRDNFFNMYIGYNRTGKSVTAKQYAYLWRMNNPDGIIAGFDPQRRFQSLIDPKYSIQAGEKFWWFGHDRKGRPTRPKGKRPLKELRNALVIMDDYRGMNRPSTTSDDLYALMEFRAEYNIDIIMVCHSPALVLEGLTMYISHYYIFYTKGKDAKFEEKIENYEECTAAANMMKAYIGDKPEIIKDHGNYYDTSGKGNHQFPHVIVDTTTGELITQKIDKEWFEANAKNYMPQM